MSCNYKSVCQIAVGDILTKDCRGEPGWLPPGTDILR